MFKRHWLHCLRAARHHDTHLFARYIRDIPGVKRIGGSVWPKHHLYMGTHGSSVVTRLAHKVCSSVKCVFVLSSRAISYENSAAGNVRVSRRTRIVAYRVSVYGENPA